MKRAIVDITTDALERFIDLPVGCHIYGIQKGRDESGRGFYTLLLQGEGLPEVDSAEPTLQVRFEYERVEARSRLQLKEIKVVE